MGKTISHVPCLVITDHGFVWKVSCCVKGQDAGHEGMPPSRPFWSSEQQSGQLKKPLGSAFSIHTAVQEPPGARPQPQTFNNQESSTCARFEVSCHMTFYISSTPIQPRLPSEGQNCLHFSEAFL